MQCPPEFDRHHEKAGRIFRVGMIDYSGGRKRNEGIRAPTLAVALRNDFPDWEQVAYPYEAGSLAGTARFAPEAPALFAEPEWLDIFDLKNSWKAIPAIRCPQPGQVVFCRSAAQRYFGDEEAMGKP